MSATMTEPEEGGREKICVSVLHSSDKLFKRWAAECSPAALHKREREMGKRGIIQNHFTSPHGGSNIKKV